MTVEALEIELDAIEEGDRLRAVDEEEVAKIATSFRERGQITPIEVTLDPKRIGHYRLVAGAHRLAAARRARFETIRATIFEGSHDEACLREIDENLYRHELTPYDQANFLAKRREIWERLYGPIHPGGAPRARGQVGPMQKNEEGPAFYRTAAEKFGLSKSTIKRALRRHRINPAAWKLLKGTKIAKKGSELDLLAKQEADDQIGIARDAIKLGSVRKAIQKQPREPTSPTEVPGRVGTVLHLIEKLSTAERKELWRHAQLRKLVPQGGNDEG